MLQGPEREDLGYQIPADGIPISLENAHTDYSEEATTVRFRLSNGNRLILYFPQGGGCRLFRETEGRPPRTTAQFRAAFPIDLCLVPVLGPVEHEEDVVQPETVRRNLGTHRASRNFRNYWYHNPDGFESFASLVRETWSGMDIQRPGRVSALSSKLTMFCLENRITRELFWAGSGFQIWCQLLTQITRATADSIVVIDEPEIYLHPDIQRQLLAILRGLGCDVLLATHSTEIMSDSEPSEILVIDKARQSANRLKDTSAVQEALESIGSTQNLVLSQLARHRRVVFVEGLSDFKLILRFARRAGFAELSSGRDLSAIQAEGASWERITAVAWGIEKTIGTELRMAVVLDPDYRSPEEQEEILNELSRHAVVAHFHERKEIENYLLVPSALQRALEESVAEREARTGVETEKIESVVELLEEITDELRVDVQAQYIAKRRHWLKGTKTDDATLVAETTRSFESRWTDLAERLKIVPGKTVLRRLRLRLQDSHSASLSSARIVACFKAGEIPADLRDLLARLEKFRAR
jgi:hypothetical protein